MSERKGLRSRVAGALIGLMAGDENGGPYHSPYMLTPF
jgi:hypothetical protein